MAFQGSLTELHLPDIIQLISVSGKTGVFHLSDGPLTRQIYPHHGTIDGHRSIKTIAGTGRLSVFDVSKILYGLIATGLIRLREAAAESPVRTVPKPSASPASSGPSAPSAPVAPSSSTTLLPPPPFH